MTINTWRAAPSGAAEPKGSALHTIAALVLVAIVAVRPQAIPQTPRDTAPSVSSGTAVITGVVVDGDAVPVPGAQVVAGNQALRNVRVVETDVNGRYTIDRLPSAAYTLHASKAGLTTSAFGSNGLADGVLISLADGERFEATIALPRVAAISGTILDEYGSPAVATVSFLIRRPANTRGSPLSRVREIESDRQGRYRIEGLPAGNYLVRADRPKTPVDVRQIEGGRERTVTYLPVYYPGVSSSTAARPVSVEPGIERSGIDLQLQLVHTTSFQGTLVDRSGQPLAGAATRLLGDDEGLERYGTASADGRFQFVGVPAGRYVLAARAAIGELSREKRTVLWGSQELFVSPDAPVSPAVTFHAGADITGHVVFDGAAPIPEFRRLPTPLVQLLTVSGVFMRFNLPEVVIGPDDPAAAARPFKTSIRFDGVPPGRMLIVGAPTLQGIWSVRSAVMNGVDVSAIPVDLNSSQRVDDLIVTLTDRATTLSGTIKNEIGDPVFAHTVVVFPVEPRARWEAPGARIRMVRPDSRGKYTVPGLPAGDYLIGLARDLSPARIVLADLLDSLETAAVRVRLVEGKETVQNLQTRDR
jgi:hypothetical protein